MRNKNCKKFIDTAKKPTTSPIKIATHRVIQKIAETAGEWKSL